MDNKRTCTYAVRFARLLDEHLQQAGRIPFKTGIAVLGTLLVAAICWLKVYNVLWFWYAPTFQVYSLVVSAYVFTRVALSFLYREPEDKGYLPSVSIVIAVKNEVRVIAKTVEHCLRSRYPAHLLEVIVVDDGSTDRTWEVLTGFSQTHRNLKLFRFPKQRGKRHAMALGAEKASGEILIYVDSDSLIEPEGVYRIVQAFTDRRIGAVAGHIMVVMDQASIISKMESVRYFWSHRVIKAAESVFGTVTCCSGAFSAYRRDAVMKILPSWLNQRFLGIQTTFGDDRSLTNYILRDYRVVFHNSARCWTYVPDNWPKFFRQQLRWKKSWTRETTVAARIMWRKDPLAAVGYYVGTALTLLSPLIVLRAVVYMPLFMSVSCLPYLVGLALVYMFLSLIYLYYTRSSHWCYGLLFAALYVSVLSWQNYYAMITVNRTYWGTR